MKKRSIPALAIATISFAACGTLGSERIVVLRGGCPDPVEYSDDFNVRLADEIEALPSDSAIPQAISDFIGLNDAVRECER